MTKISFALTMTAAFLTMLGMVTNVACAADGPASSKAGRTNDTGTRPSSVNKKILIAYFSHSGNTREIAKQIHKNTGGDIFEIQAVQPYPTDYDTVVDQARRELDSGYLPALKTKVGDIRQYDVIFIGYPNWWGTFPAPVKTFLTQHDLSGKTIVPFCTHEGSGLGRSVADISKLCAKSTVIEAIAIRGRTVKSAHGKVTEWLQKVGVTKSN